MKHYVGTVFVAKTEVIVFDPNTEEVVKVQKGHLLLIHEVKHAGLFYELCFLDLVHGIKLYYILIRESAISWLEDRMEVLV